MVTKGQNLSTLDFMLTTELDVTVWI